MFPTKWLAMALLVCCAAALPNCSMANDDEADEVKVPIDQLPPAVRATLTRESAGAATGIKEADKEMDHAKAVYEADAIIAGKNYEIKVGEDGTLLSKTLDNEADEAASATSPAK